VWPQELAAARDFDFDWLIVDLDEADSKVIVDTDGVLPLAIAFQQFESGGPLFRRSAVPLFHATAALASI